MLARVGLVAPSCCAAPTASTKLWCRAPVSGSRVARHICKALDYRAAETLLSDRAKAVELFYTEVWAHNTVELLDCLCNGSVTYSDARGGGSDVFGRAGLAEMIGDCCASHPLLHIEVDDISLDATGSSATCEWHATAADLLPSRSGAPPTGLVSEVCGCDQLTFGPDGRIRAILSFRDRFAEEEAVAEAEAETDADDY
ncbi:hypothetical protein MNEG_7248 [Monoraphidium neglectum]|uniref:SnoaL-like domain-containing protein n=1 Tax=Monoraphidium neglectum TaxID=145388 RepID=A0A0D2MJD0_9CHLO|nr:hypothetical protein MNEG_7248 [Monoraphidium neglectum]KIZ00712.1 hypothetical protein MNEG_7248 [Monoraphidium neglectum]|eukprot:XP_013899731.1 hypothetical protein MNEG_7248 [Monoraphidium neglectum]